MRASARVCVHVRARTLDAVPASYDFVMTNHTLMSTISMATLVRARWQRSEGSLLVICEKI